MIQNLSRCTSPTVGVINAGGAVATIDEIMGESVGQLPQVVVGLDAHAGFMARAELAPWIASTTSRLERSGSILLLLDEVFALANGLRLPQNAGLTRLTDHLAIVTRIWTLHGLTGRPDLTIIGPISVPHHARYMGSTWTHGLFSPEDLDRLPPAPTIIMDSVLHPRDPPPRLRVGEHPTDQFAWTILDRAATREVWVRGGPGDVALHSPISIHRVYPGEISAVPLVRRV